jgi:hypothetical protein
MPETPPVPEQPPPPETSPPPETVPEPSPLPESPVPPATVDPSHPVPATANSASSTPDPESGKSERPASASGSSSHPTKVRIDTPGASVEIEANESLAEVVATAMRLFHEAGGWPQVDSRSAGFAQAERRETYPVQPSSMPYGPGSYPVQLP